MRSFSLASSVDSRVPGEAGSRDVWQIYVLVLLFWALTLVPATVSGQGGRPSPYPQDSVTTDSLIRNLAPAAAPRNDSISPRAFSGST
ncbi:MAG: hypothetical protein AAFN92_15275, partial [Bacteroidota bacterium]